MATGSELKALVGNGSGGSRGADLKALAEQAQAPSRPESFLQRGIARTAGGIVDLADELTNIVGLPDIVVSGEGISVEPSGSAEPLGGQQSIEQGFRAAGVPTPRRDEQPQTLGARVAQGVGDAAGALLPLGTASRAAAGGRGAVAQAAQNINRTLTSRPALALGAEATSGAASGAGGFAGQQIGEGDPNAIVIGELLGGLSPAIATSVARFAPTAVGGRLAARAVRNTFTTGGGKRRAARRIADQAFDPEAAARAQREESISSLTPAQRADQPGLFRLERAVRNQNAELDEQFQLRFAEQDQQLQQAARDLSGDASIGDTREFIARQRERLDDLLTARIRQAGLKAQQRLDRIQPQRRASESSRIVREEIENALADARKQEEQLFAAVPDDVSVPTENLRDALQARLAGRGITADPEDIPEFVTDLVGRIGDDGGFTVGRLGEQASFLDMRTLRSRILRSQRAERAKDAPNKTKLDILDDLQGAILEDLGAAAGNVRDEAGQALRAAIDFSADLNQRFTRGNVGRVLGFERRGGPSVAPEQTLETTVGRQGTRGAVATDEVLNALQNGPMGRAEIENFIRDRFQASAVRDGQVSQRAARQFIERNADILDRFPGLRRDLEDAATAQQLAQRTERTLGGRQQALQNQRRSEGARFLGSREGEEIAALTRARSPRRAAREIVREASRDESGQALRGLKGGAVDFLFKNAAVGDVDEAGGQIISGRAFRNLLQSDRVRPVIGEIFGPEERAKLDRIADEFIRIERSRRAQPASEGVINDRPNQLLSIMARVTGAQVGRGVATATGGGTVQTPGIFSGQARRLIESLTNDKAQQIITRALQPDGDELFRTLLIDFQGSPQRARVVNQRLNAFLAGPGRDLIESDEEERPRPAEGRENDRPEATTPR